VKFRHPTDLSEAVIDILVGIEFLRTENIKAFELIGHFFGGAVIIQVAANEYKVKTVVTFATQSYGIGPISLLPEGTSVLLIHGDADKILPSNCSIYAYNLAREPKKLKIYENAGHGLNEASDEVYSEVKQWLKENLK